MFLKEAHLGYNNALVHSFPIHSCTKPLNTALSSNPLYNAIELSLRRTIYLFMIYLTQIQTTGPERGPPKRRHESLLIHHTSVDDIDNPSDQLIQVQMGYVAPVLF